MATPQPMKIIIMGPPAAGKGTQCEHIKKRYGVVHLSTGDMLRSAVENGTGLGLTAKAFMDRGELVPDDIVEMVVQQRLLEEDCQTQGWLLDGFPRTGTQAKFLVEEGFIPDYCLSLNVPEPVLVERVVGRRSDPETGLIYHLSFNPPPPEVVDRLVHRSDDTEESLKVRMAAFNEHVAVVKQAFPDQLREINGNRRIDAVTVAVDFVLSGKKKRALKLLIMGPPASGKGTQGKYIAKQYGVLHLSSGDMLRAAVQSGSELGLAVKGYMDRSDFVPDNFVNDCVKSRLLEPDAVEKGTLLDGYPRRLSQAQFLLAEGLKPDVAICLAYIPDSVLLDRGLGRRTDPVTGQIYHLVFKPPPPDPEIMNRLVQRAQDNRATLLRRIEVYHQQQAIMIPALVDIVRVVDGSQSPQAVSIAIDDILSEFLYC